MEEAINLKELIMIFKKRLILIVTFTCVATLLSGAFTHFLITPTYLASTQLLVSTSSYEGMITRSEITADIQLINTYTDILRSPIILNQVIEELELNMSVASLSDRITTGNRNNSQVITLSVRHEIPETARAITNEIATIFHRDLPNIMNVNNVSILAYAELPTSPISPRIIVNVAVGFMMGAIMGIALAFVLEFLDKTVKTEEEVVKLLQVPVLGVVSSMTTEDVRVQRF